MKKILVIDDDALVAATLVEALRCNDFDVQAALTGVEGMALASQFVPNLVLLDLRLPDISGIEVATELKSAGMPFVVLSAYDDREAVRCTTELGALCYLVKPLAVKQIIPIVEALTKRGEELFQLRKNDDRLQGVLDTGLVVATATGIMMERNEQDQRNAYEYIRQSARSQRRKVRDTATEIVLEAEQRAQRNSEQANLGHASLQDSHTKPAD